MSEQGTDTFSKRSALLTCALTVAALLGLAGLFRTYREQQDAMAVEESRQAALQILPRIKVRLQSDAEELLRLTQYGDDQRGARERATEVLLQRPEFLSLTMLDRDGETIWEVTGENRQASRLPETPGRFSGGDEEAVQGVVSWEKPIRGMSGHYLINLAVLDESAEGGGRLVGRMDLTWIVEALLPPGFLERFTLDILPDQDTGRALDAARSAFLLLDPPGHETAMLLSRRPDPSRALVHGLFAMAALLTAALGVSIHKVVLTRNQRERAVSEQEDQFSVFASVSLVGIFHSNAQGDFTYVNDRWCQMTGLSRDDSLGNRWMRALHPDDRERVAAEWTVASRDGIPFDSRYRFVRPDGSLLWVAGKAAAVRDAQGHCQGYFGSLTDITEGKMNEMRLASLFEGAPVSLWLEDFSGVRAVMEELLRDGVVDFESHFEQHPEVVRRCLEAVEIVDVNRSALDLYQADDLEELSQTLRSFLLEEQTTFKRQLLSLAEGETRFAFETRITTALGEKRDVVFKSLIAPDVPDWSCVYVAVIDLSDRRKAEEALARSEAFLSDTGRMARVGGWEVDADSRTLRWTKETYRIHDMPLALLPTLQEAAAFFEGRDEQRFLDLVERALSSGSPFDTELHMLTRRGRRRVVHVICRPEFSRGEVVRLSGTIQDISRRKFEEQERISLERQVQHAQKLESLGVLAGGIAHDFNNILMAILGHADIALQKSRGSSDQVTEHLHAIERSTRRAADLAQQMLAYSGRGQFVIQPIELNELVKDMADMLSVSISKMVTLDFDLAAALPSFQGDATQIRQVIMNLLTNSSEAIEQVGRVILKTGVMVCSRSFLDELEPQPRFDEDEPRTEGPYVYLEVRDTGRGMAPDVVRRLFDPFFTTKFTGRGLGMAAVLGIVRGHKGGIKVESTPGVGTSVTVLFPASPVVAAGETLPMPPSPAQSEAALDGAHVLLADDEPAIREIGRTMLERLGLVVTEAADGIEAVNLFAENPGKFQYVLLDLTMPRLDGGTVFDRIKQLDPGVKIILVSGYSERDAMDQLSGRHLAGFLQKPFRLSALEASLLQAN